MTTECARIADQLRRAFYGKAWHGPSIKDLLAEVSAQQASLHPVARGHSIWELVLHIEVWASAAAQATQGVPMAKIFETPEDWPSLTAAGPKEWQAATKRLFVTCERLSGAIEKFGDSRLLEIVPGRQYDFYYLFHGIVQHSLYHAGQIGLLKKALATA